MGGGEEGKIIEKQTIVLALSDFTLEELRILAEERSASIDSVVSAAARGLAGTLSGRFPSSEVEIPDAARSGGRPHSVELELDLSPNELEILSEESERQSCELAVLVRHAVMVDLANPGRSAKRAGDKPWRGTANQMI